MCDTFGSRRQSEKGPHLSCVVFTKKAEKERTKECSIQHDKLQAKDSACSRRSQGGPETLHDRAGVLCMEPNPRSLFKLLRLYKLWHAAFHQDPDLFTVGARPKHRQSKSGKRCCVELYR